VKELVSFFGNNLAGMAPVLDLYQPFFPSPILSAS